MEPRKYRLKDQGLTPGSCTVRVGDHHAPDCRATLNEDPKGLLRLVRSIHLSRPENYLSIYQSGCNLACRKCHSWSFAKVNFDTNGYLTRQSLSKVLEFTTSITFDIKAFNDEVHLALTGASSAPVLRNAAFVGNHAKEKLWEYRILVIPGINVEEIDPLCRFIADIDVQLPVCFLAFRPNYVLEHRAGATAELMGRCVEIAASNGLKRAYWAGQTGIHGSECHPRNQALSAYKLTGARAAGAHAYAAGCRSHPRNCAACTFHQSCAVKRHVPQKNK